MTLQGFEAGEAGAQAAWVHAHLHRVEGGLSDASYWYHRAGHPGAQGDLIEERRKITETLLTGSAG